MVNIELNKYANSLRYTSYKALKPKGAQWTPANEVNNLINRHAEYTTQIPAIKYNELIIGVTSLGFVKWEKAQLKNPIETPYTPEGRNAYYERTTKKQPLPRDDITMSLTLSELIAKGLTDSKYNFEYLMNRAYAFNRDKWKCKVCSKPILGNELETHHIDPNLALDQINKVPNLASVHKWCHDLIHSTKDVSHLVSKKDYNKILKFRKKLNQKPEVV